MAQRTQTDDDKPTTGKIDDSLAGFEETTKALVLAPATFFPRSDSIGESLTSTFAIGADPATCSEVPENTDLTTYLSGLKALGLPSTPQGERLAGLMESATDDGKPLYRRVVVQFARRSAKTTSIGAVILGRLMAREKYRVAMTAQSRTIARLIWLELVQALDALYADQDADERPYDVRLAAGSERLTWRATGSFLVPLTPSPQAFRSQAFDCVWIDEGGAIRAELAAGIKAGVMPTLDTRPSAQLIISGTPGDAREGLLWDALEYGRSGKGGILEYAARETDDIHDEAVWWRCHPGLASGMTTIETIRERHDEMPPEDFAQEYLCRWKASSSVTAIDEAQWLAAGSGDLSKPERFAIAADVEPNGDSAAVVAAWRDDEGKAHIMLIDARSGSAWVPGVIHGVTKASRKTPVAMDNIGANSPVIEALRKRRPAPNVASPPFRSLQGACMTLVREIEQGNLIHSDQPELNAAALSAVWRERDGGRVFGRKASKRDVSPLVAAAVALWCWDQQPAKRSLTVISA